MRRKLIALAAAGAAILPVIAAAEAPDIRSLPFALTQTHLTRTVTGFIADTAEPSIALSAKDHVFMCGPNGFPGGHNTFVRSADWKTWQKVDILDRTGGGDCDVRVGADGAVYTANLQLWASAIRKSVDDGQTFEYQTSEDAVEQDRQWLAPDPVDGSILYLAYHDWTISAIVVAKSVDGGKTFLVHSVVSSDPVIHARGGRSTIPGPLRVDPTNHNRLYMVWSVGSLEDCAADPQNRCAGLTHRTIVVGRSDDGGLTWQNRVAMEGAPGSRLGVLIPWLSLDQAGNPYVTSAGWTTDASGVKTNGLFMTASADRGDTWSPTVKVNAGSGATVFPTVVGGASGIADLAWLESTAASADDATGVWRVRFAQSRNALAPSPTFTEIQGPIVHLGAVCTQGLQCSLLGGDRTMLDFIDMQLDSFGYVHIAATANATEQAPPLPPKATARHILYWRQDAGPSAASEPCAVPGGADCVTLRPGPRP